MIGKTCVITGANGGIELATAAQLGALGARLSLDAIATRARQRSRGYAQTCPGWQSRCTTATSRDPMTSIASRTPC